MALVEYSFPPPPPDAPAWLHRDYEQSPCKSIHYHEKEPVAPCFRLPSPAGPVAEAIETIELHSPGRSWGVPLKDEAFWCRSGSGWRFRKPNLALCAGCRTMVNRDLVVTEWPEGYRAKRSVMVGCGYHRVPVQDATHFAALLHVVAPHILEMVGTAELAEALELDPSVAPQGVNLYVALAAPGSGVYGDGDLDWSLLLASLPDGGLEYTLAYRSEPRPLKIGKRKAGVFRQSSGLPAARA